LLFWWKTLCSSDLALRSRVLAESSSFADFLASLDLKIDIRELNGAGEITRAAQMTQRTNQFNFTAIRFNEAEMRALVTASSMRILAAFVRDRFGDYGQVGLVMYEPHQEVLRVPNMLLSCRALGKGVEHAMMARLGEIAAARSLPVVEIPFVATPKNMPGRHVLRIHLSFFSPLNTTVKRPSWLVIGWLPPEISMIERRR
jgi:FkbH-like protein